jgi:hypothetical protein
MDRGRALGRRRRLTLPPIAGIDGRKGLGSFGLSQRNPGLFASPTTFKNPYTHPDSNPDSDRRCNSLHLRCLRDVVWRNPDTDPDSSPDTFRTKKKKVKKERKKQTTKALAAAGAAAGVPVIECVPAPGAEPPAPAQCPQIGTTTLPELDPLPRGCNTSEKARVFPLAGGPAVGVWSAVGVETRPGGCPARDSKTVELDSWGARGRQQWRPLAVSGCRTRGGGHSEIRRSNHVVVGHQRPPANSPGASSYLMSQTPCGRYRCVGMVCTSM